jgi:hypothetical protein
MIVGICGAIGSGKDTVAQYICDSREYVRVSMAAALKDAAAVVFGWDRDMLEGLTQEHRAQREQPDPFWAEKLGIPGFSPRMALQIVGTDLFRDHFHPEIWVFAAERKIMQATNVVISDIRFPNEIEMIRRHGGQIWHVKRGDDPVWWQCAKNDVAGNAVPPNTMGLKYPNIHFSEWAWTNTHFDIVLHNDHSLAMLYNHVEQVLQYPGVIHNS